MNNDENKPHMPIHGAQKDERGRVTSTEVTTTTSAQTQTQATAPAPAPARTALEDSQQADDPTQIKGHSNLMPKTIQEIREIHARGRKLVTRRRYIRKSGHEIQKVAPKTEEEIMLEKLQREKDIKELPSQIIYSGYYSDDEFEYRHVILPMELYRWLPQGVLLKREQWMEVGVHQSTGWEHYMIYAPEPNILLFKREKNYLTKYGDHDPQYPPEELELIRKEQEELKRLKEQKRLEEQQLNNNIPETSDIPPK